MKNYIYFNPKNTGDENMLKRYLMLLNGDKEAYNGLEWEHRPCNYLDTIIDANTVVVVDCSEAKEMLISLSGYNTHAALLQEALMSSGEWGKEVFEQVVVSGFSAKRVIYVYDNYHGLNLTEQEQMLMSFHPVNGGPVNLMEELALIASSMKKEQEENTDGE